MQEHRHVHVVTKRVDPVRGADAAAVTIAGIDEHRQIRARHADAFGHRQRTTVNAMESIGPHVVRKAARATDARHEHGLLRPQPFIATQPLNRCENRVVAAACAPARHTALIVLKLMTLLAELHQAFSGDGCHGNSCAFGFSFNFSISTRRIVLGLIG